MGEKIKMLENHSHLSPDLFNIFQITGKLCTIDNYLTALMFLQPVDTANHS